MKTEKTRSELLNVDLTTPDDIPNMFADGLSLMGGVGSNLRLQFFRVEGAYLEESKNVELRRVCLELRIPARAGVDMANLILTSLASVQGDLESAFNLELSLIKTGLAGATQSVKQQVESS